MILNAPAKVNLHLEIRGLEPGGYHEILSIVHSVPLFDRIHIRSLKQKNVLRFHCDPPVSSGENIAVTAVRRFRATSGLEAGLEVRIEKKIPVGAGLGGGSSDAATVLGGLNRLFSHPLSREQLQDLAAGLGSDVPFFLHGPAALISGRGDIIQDLTPRGDLVLLLVYPGFPISTARAYRWFDEDGEPAPHTSSSADLKAQFEEKSPLSWNFFNSFQSVIESRYPLIGEITGKLERSGAHPTALSGSGSSVFGVFTDMKAARSAYRRLRRGYAGVWLLVPLQSGGIAD